MARLGVVSDEEREAADERHQVLQRRQRDSQAVVRGGAAAQLIHDYQAARRGRLQDRARLAQLLRGADSQAPTASA